MKLNMHAVAGWSFWWQEKKETKLQLLRDNEVIWFGASNNPHRQRIWLPSWWENVFRNIWAICVRNISSNCNICSYLNFKQSDWWWLKMSNNMLARRVCRPIAASPSGGCYSGSIYPHLDWARFPSWVAIVTEPALWKRVYWKISQADEKRMCLFGELASWSRALVSFPGDNTSFKHRNIKLHYFQTLSQPNSHNSWHCYQGIQV